MEIVGTLMTLIGIVIVLGIVSTIYVEDNSQLTLENAKGFGHKILDTVELWRS